MVTVNRLQIKPPWRRDGSPRSVNPPSSILDPIPSVPYNLSPVTSRAACKEAGYTLAVVMVFTSVVLVTLSGAVINWQKSMQREREEELIYRGKQFMRAVELWQRKFPGTYPTTVDALLSTNNTRFLRKKWKDPITNSDEWRLLKVNPDGSISGLTVIPGSSPLGPSAFGGSTSGGTSSGGGRTTAGTPGGTSGAPGMGRPQPTSAANRSGGQSAFNPVLGGIVGIASKSEKESLKSYNGRSKYNEWEFVFIPRGPQPGAGPNAPQGGQPQPQGGGPAQGGRGPQSGVPQQPQPQAQPR